MWMYYALTAAILWGFEYTINGRILQNIQPQSLLIIQLGLGFMMFCVFELIFKTNVHFINDVKWILNNWHGISFIVLSVLVYLIANFCIYQSIVFKNSALAAVVETTYPLFTFLFCYLLFKENIINFKVCLGGVLIFLGVCILNYA